MEQLCRNFYYDKKCPRINNGCYYLHIHRDTVPAENRFEQEYQNLQQVLYKTRACSCFEVCLHPRSCTVCYGFGKCRKTKETCLYAHGSEDIRTLMKIWYYKEEHKIVISPSVAGAMAIIREQELLKQPRIVDGSADNRN